jgi:hypothetical protein
MSLSELDRQELLRALREDAPRFGPRLATLAFERGLAVTDRTDGSRRPIPVTATPVLVEPAELRRRQRLAALLSSATLKMARLVLATDRAPLVLDGLSPLERELARTTFARLATLVTTRVDFFVGGGVKALEVNATIPAMQGYSDVAADTFLEVVGAAWGAAPASVARWKADNGSNSRALFDALQAGYAQVRPGRAPRRIALLSRRNDAQLSEQEHLCARFRAWGADAEVVHPDQLRATDQAVSAGGEPFDLVYRHLFVRRLEEPGLVGAGLVRALLAEPNGTRAVVLNPPASQVEVKAVFALLSQAQEDAALAREGGLAGEELAAVAEAVPWTRVFRGEALQAQVAAEPDRYVLKRSWDYGGRAVFLGKSRGEPSFTERARAAYGEALDWNGLCARAVLDRVGGGFVVQEVVETRPEEHLLCGGGAPAPASLFVDFSAYASVGLPEQPGWGGVCRGSPSRIVNIVGGGGVLPLLTTPVAEALLTAHRSWVK